MWLGMSSSGVDSLCEFQKSAYIAQVSTKLICDLLQHNQWRKQYKEPMLLASSSTLNVKSEFRAVQERLL